MQSTALRKRTHRLINLWTWRLRRHSLSTMEGDVLDWLRIVPRFPKRRRVVIDCDGKYNDAISIVGDYNHESKQRSRRWIQIYDALSDKIFFSPPIISFGVVCGLICSTPIVPSGRCRSTPAADVLRWAQLVTPARHEGDSASDRAGKRTTASVGDRGSRLAIDPRRGPTRQSSRMRTIQLRNIWGGSGSRHSRQSSSAR